MAIITKTLDEVKKEMTPARMKQISEALKYHKDEYDEDCPPLTDEELARFRPYKEVQYERELIKRFKAGDSALNTIEREKARQIIETHANDLIYA